MLKKKSIYISVLYYIYIDTNIRIDYISKYKKNG